MDWIEIKQVANDRIKSYAEVYLNRLIKEIAEIEKQGANAFWEDATEVNKKWNKNVNGLVLPYILGMTDVDPIKNNIDHYEDMLTDNPDIDLDFLPHARQTIKEYAQNKYVHVCSVGNWVTYKPKSALIDVARALGSDWRLVMKITKELPDEFDDLGLEDLQRYKEQEKSPDKSLREEAHREVAKYAIFYEYWIANQQLVNLAYKVVDKIKTQSTHAGGVIIADRPIENIIPLTRIHGNWTSQWTEGKSTQLSKFGLVKFDILGVKTLFYIWQACNLIKRNYGVSIDWDDMDPTTDPPRAGYQISKDGVKEVMSFCDAKSFKMCNELKTDSVFQIESNIQKGIINDGKVKSFWDLVVYNAMGRPGPIDMIPQYIKRRNDASRSWKIGEDERVIRLLSDTFGIICYQEQLTSIWMELARFSATEADECRKIISKKWLEKLPKVEQRWLKGASKTIGEKAASEWWSKMVTFGRYAFNKAHAVAYSIITYRCLYLKAHFPAEWWAAVLTECPIYKHSVYMGAARLEGVKFGIVDINNLTHEYDVVDNTVVPGLQSIKGVGEKASKKFCSVTGPFKSLDDIVEKFCKDKRVFERLIKLGGFDKLYKHRKALWVWYQFKYCSGKEITQLRKDVSVKFVWPEEEILKYRQTQLDEFKRLYPNKKKIPITILNWKPKISPTYEQMIDFVGSDYTVTERLIMEKEFLGYYVTNPLEPYQVKGHTIEDAKKTGIMEGIIEKLESKTSKSGNKFYHLHLTDGIQNAKVIVWVDSINSCDPAAIKDGVGVRINIEYDPQKGFKIQDRTRIIPLLNKSVDISVSKVKEEYLLW